MLNGVYTIASNGTITGDITSADWAARQRRLPNCTGTHAGNKTNIKDLTASTQP